MRFFFSTSMNVFMTVITATATAQDFQPLSSDIPQGTTRVEIPDDCSILNEGNKKVPLTMFTFVPMPMTTEGYDTTRISTYPNDLLIANTTHDSKELILNWNPDVAFNAIGGPYGVQIEYSATQLESLSVHSSSQQVQILDGFTSLKNMEVTNGAELYATITTLSAATNNATDLLSVTVRSKAKAHIMAPGAAVGTALVEGDGQLDLEASTIQKMKSQPGKMHLKVSDFVLDGDISSANSQVTVDGDITGYTEVNYHGHLSIAGEVTGSVNVLTSAVVKASSCDNITGKCKTANVPGITVDVTEQPMTLDGTVDHCSGASSFGGGPFLLLLSVGMTAVTFIF